MFVLGFPTNSGISLSGMEAAVEDILEDSSINLNTTNCELTCMK